MKLLSVTLASGLAVGMAGGVAGFGPLHDLRREIAQRLGAENKARVVEAYGKLPVAFEANAGQTDPSVKFLARGSGYSLFLTSTEAVLSLTSRSTGPGEARASTDVVRMQVMGANPEAPVAGREPLPGKVNYLVGDPSSWRTGVPTYGKVRFQGVYPGVDLEYHGRQGAMEYDFIVAPNADPSAIRLGFSGADSMKIDRSGDLVLGVSGGEVRQKAPYVYQSIGGSKRQVDGSFKLLGDRVAGFELGAYDRSIPLVIDPVFGYSTFLGGNGADVGFGITVDADGNAYVAGQNGSSNFPTKGGLACASASFPTSSYQCDQPSVDAFVTKLAQPVTDPVTGVTSQSLVWSTYLGGSREDQAWDIAIDQGRNVYVAGSTISSNFPVSSSGHDVACGTDGACNGGLSDDFLVKLGPNGDSLIYGTYLGGADNENDADKATALSGQMGLAVLGSRAYVSGTTASDDDPLTIGVNEGFPISLNAFQKQCGLAAVPGCDLAVDGFLAVIDTAVSGPSSLLYGSYLGGGGYDEARGVAVDASGKAYVAGATFGLPGTGSAQVNNFPTKNASQPLYGGGISDAFLAKFDIGGWGSGSVEYSTFVGGAGEDQAWGVDVFDFIKAPDSSNKNKFRAKPVIAGFTDSEDDPSTPLLDEGFPTTSGAYDTTFNGRSTAPDGSTIFLHGDAFVSRFSSDGALEYSTYLGGGDHDVAGGVAVRDDGSIYVTGYTTCQNDNGGVKLVPPAPAPPPCVSSFPIAGSPVPQPTMNGDYIAHELHNSPTDVFVAKLTGAGNGSSDLEWSSFIGGNDFDRGFAIAVRDVDASGNAIAAETYTTGRAASTNFPTTSGSFRSTKPAGKGNRDAFVTMIRE